MILPRLTLFLTAASIVDTGGISGLINQISNQQDMRAGWVSEYLIEMIGQLAESWQELGSNPGY